MVQLIMQVILNIYGIQQIEILKTDDWKFYNIVEIYNYFSHIFIGNIVLGSININYWVVCGMCQN